jgi:hypothetical protein
MVRGQQDRVRRPEEEEEVLRIIKSENNENNINQIRKQREKHLTIYRILLQEVPEGLPEQPEELREQLEVHH